MKVQFTEMELEQLRELEQRYENRMKAALERVKPFRGDSSGDDHITQYRRYHEGLDDDSKKARQEYIDILEELTRERVELIARFSLETEIEQLSFSIRKTS